MRETFKDGCNADVVPLSGGGGGLSNGSLQCFPPILLTRHCEKLAQQATKQSIKSTVLTEFSSHKTIICLGLPIVRKSVVLRTMGVSRPPESKVVFASAECPHYIRPRNDELIKSYRRPQGEGTRAKAFTLAEVLITLGIIGIVAALTMPALIADYKEKAAVVKVKKAYNVLSNAYNLALMENGELNSWFTNMAISDSARRVNSPIFFEKIKPHLNIIKDCGLNSGCLTPGTIHAMNGSNGDGPLDTNDRQYKFVLADGTLVSLTVYIPGCKTNEVCGAIGIDVDGLKGPYAWGLDWFTFNFTPERLVPRGAPNDPGGETFAAACTKTTGYGCTGWVIINENMDYLHCDDLSWNGKTKCK